MCVCVNVACLLYVCVSMHVCWCVFVCVVFIVCFLLLLLPSLLAFVVCCRSHSHIRAMLLLLVLPMLRRSAVSLAVAVSTQFVRKKFSTACVGYGK